MASMNVVCIVGNLTRDPELRATAGGTSVCDLSVAVNSREKDGQTGEWRDRADFFDVTVWGNQADNCAQYLEKGRGVAISGRLRQERWQNQGGENRSRVKIVAHSVQFLSSAQRREDEDEPSPDQTDFASSADSPAEDDSIPF